MPLWVFIAGYLFKEEYTKDPLAYCKKKFIHLMIPYYYTNLFYGLLITYLHYKGFFFGENITLYNFFVTPFVHGHQYGLNVAMWFVPQLFSIQVIYVVFHKFKYKKELSNFVFLFILFFIGTCSVWCVKNGYSINDLRYFLFRTLFFLSFFHLGFMYKIYFEKKDTLNSYIYFSVIVILQYLLIYNYGNLSFGAIIQVYPNKVFLPYLTSVTGILFWLRISKLLVPLSEKYRLFELIGDNSWTIMAHHQLVFFLFNTVIYFTLPITGLNNFSVSLYKGNMWYTYNPLAPSENFLIFSSALGVFLPVLLKIKTQAIITNIKNKLH